MKQRLKKIVIIGATSAIAEHCARHWVATGPAEFVLVGRDPSKLQSVAADLSVRSPDSKLSLEHGDFTDASWIDAVVTSITAGGAPDIVLIAHGTLPSQADCQADLHACEDALVVNAISPILFAERFVGSMQEAGSGTLAIIGSVAGDRGRKSNYVYGAAKGAVARYAQGLQHRLASTAVRVVLIKPGPTATPMTEHLQQRGVKLGDVKSVAARIVKAIENGTPVVYAPAKWQLIMMVIRHLPRFVFNRMDI